MIECLSSLASISTCFWWISIEIRRYRRSITVASKDIHNKYLYEKLNKHYPDPELEDAEDEENI